MQAGTRDLEKSKGIQNWAETPGTQRPMDAKMSTIGPIRTIGIAMAAYNPEKTAFFNQLSSIASQTFDGFICVVSFDSQLPEFLNEWPKDRRFRFIQNPNRLGHKKNFEAALCALLKIEQSENLHFDAIAFSDQDDFWYKDKLEVCARRLESCSTMSLVHSDMHSQVDGIINSKTTWQIEHRGVNQVKPQHLMIRNVVAGCSLLMDANLARSFPTIPDAFEYHDHFYALLASHFGAVVPISTPLFKYIQHANNVVGVTEYHSLFHLNPELKQRPFFQRISEIFKKCARGYKKSNRMIESCIKIGIQIDFKSRFLYLRPFDFGMGIFLLGIGNLFRDPPLARAAFARSFGKALITLGFKT